MPSIPILDTAGHGNHHMHAIPHKTRMRVRPAQTFRILSGDSRTRRHRIPPHPQHAPTQRQRYIRAGTPDISRRKPATIPGHAPLASPHKHDRQHPPDTTEFVTESYRKKIARITAPCRHLTFINTQPPLTHPPQPSITCH